jgi:hypothetical protein
MTKTQTNAAEKTATATKARKSKARKAKAPKVRPGNAIQPSGWTLKEERLLAKITRYVARNPALADAVRTAVELAREDESAAE